MHGKWTAKEEKPVYESDWLTVTTAETELSDGTTIDHHFVRCGEGGAGVLVHDPDKGILMIWRHRQTSQLWGWELPGGRVEVGEKPRETAMRELEEETGWRVTEVEDLITYQPVNGFLDHPFYLYYATKATWVGPEPDKNEVADLAWIPLDKLPELISKGEISSGFTLTPLLFALAMGPLAHTH